MTVFENKKIIINIWFSVYLFNEIKMQTSLEISASIYNDWTLQVFIMMTWLYVSILDPASQLANLVTALGIHYFSSSCLKKKSKITGAISYSNKTLMRFRRDAPNSHVPGINFLEFLVHALSITSHHSWLVNLQRICL